MIYFTTNDHRHILILEPGNVECLRHGHAVVSNDKLVMVAYTPNVEWTMEAIKKALGKDGKTLDPAMLDAILKEGILQPPVVRRARPKQNPTQRGRR